MMTLQEAMGLNQQVIKSPTNPLDRATLVSIVPKEIVEVKHTISPGTFVIKPGSFEKPSLLIIEPSSWWREIDHEMPLLEIPVGAVRIADSIIKDYCNGLFACNMRDSMPGLFFVPGEKTVKQILSEHATELSIARARQRKWFETLIMLTDILWANTNGNPKCVSEDAKLAAQELQLKDKPWLKDFNTLKMTNCPACGALRNGDYPVCQVCHNVVDVKAYEAAGFKKV